MLRRWAIWCAFSLLILFFSSPAPAFDQEEQSEVVSIKTLGHETKTLSRNLPLAEFWFEVPGNWQLTQSGEFILNYSHPQTTAESEAIVEVELNGQVVHKEHLGKQAVTQDTLTIPLAVSEETPQGLHLVVHYKPRGDNEGCFAPDPRPFIVQDSSSYHVNYRVRPSSDDLAQLPYPFAFPRGRDAIPLTFVMTEDATNAHYEAAVRLMGWWGRESANTSLEAFVIPPQQIKKRHFPGRNLVVIGKDAYERIRPKVLSHLSGCVSLPDNYVALCTPHDTLERADAAVLVLNVAAEKLTETARELERGGSHWKGDLYNVNRPFPSAEEQENLWDKDEIPFSDLELSDVTFRGLGESERTFYIRRPRGWQLGPASQMSLHFSGAGPTKETKIRPAINGVELPTATLPKDLDATGRVTFEFPEDARLNRDEDGGATDYLIMRVRVEHDIENKKEEDCDPRQGLMSTTLHDDSSFRLRPESPKLPDLAWFPFPFSDPRPNSSTLFLLPPERETPVAAALLAVAGEIGRGTIVAPNDVMVRLTDKMPAQAADRHLVVVGWADSIWNRWAQAKTEATPNLPSVPVSAEFGKPIGQIIEQKSPLNPRRQLLLIQAQTERLDLVARSLKDTDLSGSRMVVDETGAAIPIQFGSAVSVIKKKAQAALSKSLDDMSIGIVHVLVVILLLTNVSFAFLWVLERKRKQHEKAPSTRA